MHFTQNVANVTFIFGTSPNTKPEGKKWRDMANDITPPEKVVGRFPRIPHQTAPMVISHADTLTFCNGNV